MAAEQPIGPAVTYAPALLAAALVTIAATASAATLSASDAAFVAKVSQGGMFEVESSKLAMQKADAQDVKDVANTEVHDHELVGDKLRAIAASKGITLDTQLNASFSKQMAHLQTLSGAAFDNAYIAAMDTVHAGDGAAFDKEAKLAKDPELKAFAAQTALIVKRHIGALHAPGTETTD